jgi:hypothetical protein
MVQTSSNRSYAAAHFALELDIGGKVGLFRSIEGGGLKADVMTYQGGGAHGQFRQLGKPKFDDLKLQVGMAARGGRSAARSSKRSRFPSSTRPTRTPRT